MNDARITCGGDRVSVMQRSDWRRVVCWQMAPRSATETDGQRDSERIAERLVTQKSLVKGVTSDGRTTTSENPLEKLIIECSRG